VADDHGNQPAGAAEIDKLVQEARNNNRRVSVTTVADTYTGTGEEVHSASGTITIQTGDETYVIPIHAIASVRSRD
jgi:hypothetical protein